ncbi:hypothetical protein C2E23DRAFT_833742 [Lenzites betulinus]|nr:hypothetical protein C2E23DRAFT_833742 [Lenzites betulinus]
MLVLFVIIAVTDQLTLLYMSRIMKTVYADVGTVGLEFASPYHGLAELYSSDTVSPPQLDPILNVPRVVAQVFTDRPDELAPVGEHDVFIKAFGTLSPHEKHLHVAQNTHTIAQFRTVDFGMEDCALVIRLPGENDTIEGNEPFRLDASSAFDVFRLDVSKPLDVRTLSYATRPRSREKVATVTPAAGEETQVTRFPCAWSTLHTFEVACADGVDDGCLVDVWSSQNTTWGELFPRLPEAHLEML